MRLLSQVLQSAVEGKGGNAGLIKLQDAHSGWGDVVIRLKEECIIESFEVKIWLDVEIWV